MRPFERVWVLLTCNWFMIGFRCWQRGHDWRSTRPTRCVDVTDCGRCGKFRGWSVIAVTGGECRWWRGP